MDSIPTKPVVWILYDHVFKSYYKFGAGATTTPFADNTSSVTNPDYKNFAFTSTGDYQIRTSVWTNQVLTPAINWTFNSSPSGIQKFSDILAELKAKYPVLGTTTLSFTENGFTKFLDGSTYEDYIQSKMNVSTAFPTEYQTISFHWSHTHLRMRWWRTPTRAGVTKWKGGKTSTFFRTFI